MMMTPGQDSISLDVSVTTLGIKTREVEKVRKHKAEVGANGSAFVAFVFSFEGEMGEQAVKFFDQLIRTYITYKLEMFDEELVASHTKWQWKCRLAVAYQRHNADMLLYKLRKYKAAVNATYVTKTAKVFNSGVKAAGLGTGDG